MNTAKRLTTLPVRVCKPENQEPIEVCVTKKGATFSKLFNWVRKHYFKKMMKSEHGAAVFEVYWFLIECQNHRTHIAHPGSALLATEAGIRKATVKPCLQWLIDNGLIKQVKKAVGRQAAEYYIVQIPAGAKVYKPDFSGSRSDISGSQDPEPEQAKTADPEPETHETLQNEPKKAGTTIEDIPKGYPTEQAVCCELSPEQEQEAQQLARYAMQISTDKDKGWILQPVLQIMRQLLQTHDKDTIHWQIQKTAPAAKSPGLIRYAVQQKPTKAQIAANKAREDAATASRIRRRHAERQQTVIISQGQKAHRAKVGEFRQAAWFQKGFGKQGGYC